MLKNSLFKKSFLHLIKLIFIFLMPLTASPLIGTAESLFVNIEPDARSMALGGAMTAQADGPSAALWNPAALSKIKKNQAQFNYNNWIGSVMHMYASAAGHLGSNLVLCVDGVYLLSPDVVEKTAGGVERKTVFNSATAGLSGSLKIGIFSAGMSARFIQQNILGDKTRSVNFGFGGLVQLGKVDLAFAAVNLGPKVAQGNIKSMQNLTGRLGVAYPLILSKSFLERISFSLDNEYAFSSGLSGRLGIETRSLFNNNKFALMLRFGAQLSESVNAVSGGVGIDMNYFTVDWGAVPRPAFGVVHSIGLSVKF